MRPAVVTQAELDAFNRNSMEVSKRLTANNPKPRRSTHQIAGEIERVKSGLDSLRSMLTKSENKLTTAENQLKAAKARLVELQGAGVPSSDQSVQQLTGFTFRSRVHDAPVYHPGVIANCEQVIAQETPRVKSLRAKLPVEEKRMKAELERLSDEYKAALKVENLVEDKNRRGAL